MRILHTSDWHLGQQFIGKSREAEHRAFFRWLINQVIELQVDVLLVAGDIFDTATPPSYAKALYHQLIVDLQPSKCHVVLLGGNHDSVAVLNESANLLGCLNTDVVPGYWQEQEKHLLALKNKAGEQKLWLLALPFLRARDLSVLTTAQSNAGQTAQEKQQQLQQQIAQVYQQLFELARARDAKFPIIATGHLTTVGASRSESEREIYIGNLEAFPAQAFPPVDYLALGHIHQAQKVAGSDYLRYCGSPIALSFDEVRQQKQVLLLEFAEDAVHPCSPLVQSIAVPCFQPLLSLTTDLASLPAMLKTACDPLSSEQSLWLELVLTGEDALLTDISLPLQQLLADLPVELLRLRKARPLGANNSLTQAAPDLQTLTPVEVLTARFADEDLSAELSARLTILHDQALEQVQTDSGASL